MKLVVGLGNPGAKYEGTRHNIGYMVLAELGRRYGEGNPRYRFQGQTMDASIGGEKVLLLSPTTYMNLSGASVVATADYYRIPPDDILVVCDDIHLPVGRLRCRREGSCGGQKGLRNIIDRLRTETFPRLRIGVGEPPEQWNAADYVLGKFTKTELPAILESVGLAADAVAVWVREGITRCMNEFNGKGGD